MLTYTSKQGDKAKTSKHVRNEDNLISILSYISQLIQFQTITVGSKII